MAGAGAKKRADDNARTINRLGVYILVCAAFYGGIRLGLKAKTAGAGSWAGLVLTLVVQAFCYLGISSMAKPVYDNGVLIDGGADLSKGTVSYYFDLCYVTGFVQVLASFSRWGWYAYLVVPLFAVYMLATKLLLPMYKASKQEEVEIDEAARKKLERTQMRAERRRVKRF